MSAPAEPTSASLGAYTRFWRRWFRFARGYHRYECKNLEILQRGEPFLVVGYHGRPVAYDLIMLVEEAREQGLMVHPIAHTLFASNAMLRRFQEDMAVVNDDGPELADAIARGEHVFVTPGGTREGSRPSSVRYQVDWGSRRGYIRLALKYGLRVVPAGGWGSDDCYVVPFDGYRAGKMLRMPLKMPFFVGFGIGLWPLALPIPVKLTTVLGEPIDLQADGPVDPEDDAAVDALHDKVVAAVQALLDARPGAGRSA